MKTNVHIAYEQAREMAWGGMHVKAEGGMMKVIALKLSIGHGIRTWMPVKRWKFMRIEKFVESAWLLIFILAVVAANTSSKMAKSIESHDTRNTGDTASVELDAWRRQPMRRAKDLTLAPSSIQDTVKPMAEGMAFYSARFTKRTP